MRRQGRRHKNRGRAEEGDSYALFKKVRGSAVYERSFARECMGSRGLGPEKKGRQIKARSMALLPRRFKLERRKEPATRG